MAKKLSDFTVRVNLHGWHIKGVVTCVQGQEFEGANIHKRMIESIEAGETFKLKGVVTPVCVLKGGKLEDLKAAMEAGEEPAPKPEKKTEAPKEPEPKPEKPADEPKDPPKRKPKPRTSGD